MVGHVMQDLDLGLEMRKVVQAYNASLGSEARCASDMTIVGGRCMVSNTISERLKAS